ncbi:GNAT family N-acetyltransferase [Nitrospinota bacterium]
MRVYTDPEDILRLAPEWRALMEASRFSHPFYDPAWHSTWWKHLGTGTVHLCTVCQEEAAPIAIAPLTLRKDGVMRFIGGEDLTDYLDIVARDGAYEEAWGALMTYLESPEAPPWKELILHSVPAASPTAEFFAKMGERATAEQEDVCPVIALPDSWDEYTGMLGQRHERELRRKVRKANLEAGLEFHRTLAEKDLEMDLKEFFQLHALSQPDKADFWNESRCAFFREMAGEMLKLGWLELTIMRVDGHPVAANFALDYEDRIYLYNSGYDPAERELSAGLVLLAQNIEQAIQAGRTSFDLLRGDEPYKYRYAAKDESIQRIRLSREAK